MKLHLVLSGRCNLACTYCYQDQRRVRARMPAATAEAALDAVLGAGKPPHEVTLSGGEPYLARPLLRRIVSSIRRRGRDAGPITCAVLTNGTLLHADDVDFLADHDVELQVSCDGGPSAMARRGRGTLEKVEALLRAALDRQERWAGRRLAVGMVLQGATLPTLASSVEDLLATGLSDLRLSPLWTHDPGWGPVARRRLGRQVDQIVTTCLRLRKPLGEPPVDFLRPGAGSPAPGPRGGAICSASSKRSVVVDPDGGAWGCLFLAPSVQRLPPLGRAAAARLDLGNVLDPGFGRRLSGLPRRAGRLPLLRDKARKHSWRGRCRDCPVYEECFVCPATTAHVPGNRDPHRVADHQCDFQYVTTRGRQRFLRDAPSSDWLFGSDLASLHAGGEP